MQGVLIYTKGLADKERAWKYGWKRVELMQSTYSLRGIDQMVEVHARKIKIVEECVPGFPSNLEIFIAQHMCADFEDIASQRRGPHFFFKGTKSMHVSRF
jgi:hypothetical protein